MENERDPVEISNDEVLAEKLGISAPELRAFRSVMSGRKTGDAVTEGFVTTPFTAPRFVRGSAYKQVQALSIVYEYANNHLEKTDTHVSFQFDDVYVVWFSSTLQNWKALVSTTLPDGMYYEVTYNGDKHETYLDAYKKFDNVCIKDEDESPDTTYTPKTVQVNWPNRSESLG